MCERVKYTEMGSFAGGIIGGVISGAALSGAATGSICLGLGIPTGGMATLVCGFVVVGTASFAVGSVGSEVGEVMGDIIYEVPR